MFQDGSDKTISSTSWSESSRGRTASSPREQARTAAENVHCIRLEPSHASLSQSKSPLGGLSTPAEVRPNTGVFLEPELTLTVKPSSTADVRIKTHCDACADTASHHLSPQQARQENWFYSLPFQRFQALLTLFSKSFSPFPHGTCLLSVSNQYLALDEIYHPICAPIPRNVTLRTQAVHEGLQMTDGTLTLTDALFQEAYICAFVGIASRDYNSRPEAPISMLSSSLFIRHY